MTTDLNTLKATLTDRIDALAEVLLGAPSIRKSRTWRWGAKGSLEVKLHGRERGSWRSYEAGTYGGPIDLVMHALGCDFPAAVAWARSWAGDPTVWKPVKPRDVKAETAAERDDQARRIEAARRLWQASKAVGGTAAERYLVATRAIPAPAGGWPDCVRFHASSCALIVAATKLDGTVQAVQLVYLTHDGRKISLAEIEARKLPAGKQSRGVMAGAVVRLPGDPAGPLQSAEGPETGLSGWVATSHETWISLGGIRGDEPPIGRTAVILRDDDAPWSPADRRLRATVKAWQAADVKTLVATPWPECRGDKSDMNDTMKAGGSDAVRARIEAALAPAGTVRNRRPIGEARAVLQSAADQFFAAAAAYDPINGDPPPVRAVKVDVGVGKSFEARRGAAKLLAGMRLNGDHRTVAFAVPTRALGEEAAAEFEALPAARASGLKAAVWHGRKAPDPDAPGETMCRDIDRVHDAQAAGQAVETACCKAKTKDGEPVVECPFYGVCGYQQQRRRRADVWFVAHELIYTGKPTAIGDLAALIVDESCWSDGLEGIDGRPKVVSLDSLAASDTVPGDPLAGDRLRFLRAMAVDALRSMSDGAVTSEAMRAVDLTAELAKEAHGLEWRRRVDPGMTPTMTPAERKAARKAAVGNSTVHRLAAFWTAMSDLLKDGGPRASGWAALGSIDTEDGPVKVLELKGRKPVRNGWLLPTLIIDATLNIDLVRPFWPSVDLIADVAVQVPHQRVFQVTDRSYRKGEFELRDDLGTDEKRRRVRHLRGLNATLATIGRAYVPGRTLVVTQQAVEKALPSVGVLPASMCQAHHNNVAGRDEWKDIAALVVVGRTAPSPASVERLAEALTGSAVERLEGWYPKVQATREMADGEFMAAEADRHPDSVCEAIRWQACEGELLQIVGRARGVNRTEADPVDLFVLTSVPLPLPLDGALAAADLAPTPVEMMLGAGGIAFENATDAAAAYPEIWSNRKASGQALTRAAAAPRLATTPYRELPIRDCSQPQPDRPRLQRVDYQRAGAGRSPAVAWVDVSIVPNVEVALASALGPLAWCRVADVTPPDPAPVEPEAVMRAPDVSDLPPLEPVAPPGSTSTRRSPQGEAPVCVLVVFSFGDVLEPAGGGMI